MRAEQTRSAAAAGVAADPRAAAPDPASVVPEPPSVVADPPSAVSGLPTGVAGVPVLTWGPARSPARTALIAAGVALVIWLGFAIFLLTQSGANEVTWGRIAWVFGSVESVAFAAAGVLFGSTVNRSQAEVAQQQAAANRGDAESGRALAALLKVDDPAGDVAARHRRLAHHLFPEGHGRRERAAQAAPPNVA